MFSFDLDNLNILVMLILAFFSFRAYNPNSLAIQYQSEKTNLNKQGQIHNDQLQMENEDKPEIDAKLDQNENLDLQQCAEVQGELYPNVLNVEEQFIEAPIQIVLKNLIQLKNETQRSLIVESLDKDEEQDSTIINRQSPIPSQNYINNFDEESSDSQVGSESSSLSVRSDDEAESSARKRKQIQKAKKKAKRHNRRHGQQVEHQVQIVQQE